MLGLLLHGQHQCCAKLAAGFGSGNVQSRHAHAAAQVRFGKCNASEDAANYPPGPQSKPATQAEGVASLPSTHSQNDKMKRAHLDIAAQEAYG